MQSRIVVAGVFALALIAQPALFAQPASVQNGAHPMQRHFPPLPKPVNLKVLPKNIPPKELIHIMRGFAGSLGVDCSFCHVRNPKTHHLDFPSDAKPQKRTARLMMRMTEAINASYIAKVHVPNTPPAQAHVTCGTCHRGHSTPPVFVPPPRHRHCPPPPPPPHN